MYHYAKCALGVVIQNLGFGSEGSRFDAGNGPFESKECHNASSVVSETARSGVVPGTGRRQTAARMARAVPPALKKGWRRLDLESSGPKVEVLYHYVKCALGVVIQ